MNLTFTLRHQLQRSIEVIIHEILNKHVRESHTRRATGTKSLVRKNAYLLLERTDRSLEIDRNRHYLENRLGHIFHEVMCRDRLK